MAIFYAARGQANHHRLREEERVAVVTGEDNLCSSIAELARTHIESNERPCFLAMDGYLGVKWEDIIPRLADTLQRSHIEATVINMDHYMKTDEEIKAMAGSCFKNDHHFGTVYDGTLEKLFDVSKIRELAEELTAKKQPSDSTAREVVICHGHGAAIDQVFNQLVSEKVFDYTVYFDITKEELFNRSAEDQICLLGDSDCSFSVHENLKRFWYFDSRVLDAHKRRVLKHLDLYVDVTDRNEPKMVSGAVYENMISSISKFPFMIKQLYYATAWGGEWQKKLKNLPDSLVNSGQGQIVPNDNSVEIVVDTGGEELVFEIPFLNLMWQEAEGILGKRASEVSRGEFPLCYFYDDQIDGGNMAIQVHPDDEYMKRNFNESGGQDESYYILHTGEGARTYIGLTDEADIDELHEEAARSEREGTKIDFEKYIHCVGTEPHDFILIPAGTIHASGTNQVVLEIDWVSTSYTPGYTFHVYDYLRPDLDGSLRDMHIDRAFGLLKDWRSKDIAESFKQEPVLIRGRSGAAEYLIGRRDDMRFETRRLEFEKQIYDETEQSGTFHALTLVEGESVTIRSEAEPAREATLQFPDTIVVPASMGRYTIVNRGSRPCKIVKAMVK